MYLLLSGEGTTDIGRCTHSGESCDTTDFQAGPMTIFIDQLIEQQLGYEYSQLSFERISFVSERYLADHKQPPKSRIKGMSLRGKKSPPETKYFYENARALSIAAKQKSTEIQDNVIAILFRDADGTASAGRGLWQDKLNSMLKGFADEEYGALGVPMIPKSEAWLLCALKNNAYQHCNQLENESGNDRSSNPLKDQLTAALNANNHQNDIIELIKKKVIDVNQISMSSLNDFKTRLNAAVDVSRASF